MLAVRQAYAQTPDKFEAFPGGIAASYRFDFARTLFASEQEEERARQALTEDFDRFRRDFAREVTASQLLGWLRSADSLDRRLNRHFAYLSLRSIVDSRLETSANSSTNAISRAASRGYQPLNEILARMSATQLDAFIREEPALRPYRFALDQRRAPVMPSITDSVRAVVQGAQATGYQWGPQRFRELLSSIDFGTVKAPEGEIDVRNNASRIVSHSRRDVREGGFRANIRGIESKKDSFALIITETAKARNTVARARGFADHREESYGQRYLDTREVGRIFNAVAATAATNKRVERLRIARIKQVFGYDTVHAWDITAPPPGLSAPRLDILQASDAVLATTRVFGAAYQSEMRALLDPKNGRLDIGPAPFRADRPGFSTGLVGYPSFFFQGRFDGYIDDVLILVHEAGHAVQNMLMDRRGVLPRYASGPGYFTESYAVLNEFLLLDHLYPTATDTATRIYYLERLLDKTSDLYRNTYESQFEDRVYDSTAAGRSLTASDLDRMFNQTASSFSVWYEADPEMQLGWSRPLQLFTRPLYRVNYTIAGLLALNYLQRMRSDASFVTRFQSLLSRGYDAPPNELLRAEVGIDMTKPEVIARDAMQPVDRWIAELEQLYKRRP